MECVFGLKERIGKRKGKHTLLLRPVSAKEQARASWQKIKPHSQVTWHRYRQLAPLNLQRPAVHSHRGATHSFISSKSQYSIPLKEISWYIELADSLTIQDIGETENVEVICGTGFAFRTIATGPWISFIAMASTS